MPRARLTPEEREARRKERSRFTFSDAAYKHYNPRVEGFGSFDEWVQKAEALIFSKGLTRPMSDEPQLAKDLRHLFLESLPGSLRELKSAYRNSLFVHHPDHGGTNEATIEALKAFERLAKQFA